MFSTNRRSMNTTFVSVWFSECECCWSAIMMAPRRSPQGHCFSENPSFRFQNSTVFCYFFLNSVRFLQHWFQHLKKITMSFQITCQIVYLCAIRTHATFKKVCKFHSKLKGIALIFEILDRTPSFSHNHQFLSKIKYLHFLITIISFQHLKEWHWYLKYLEFLNRCIVFKR